MSTSYSHLPERRARCQNVLVDTPRMYADLARWWPLLSPPEEYADEAATIAGLLKTGVDPVHTVLELGSGGGHNAVHLKRDFEMTLVDLSPDMLAVSAVLNPECEHLEGDMRALRLGRIFDAVLIHDAIDYMLTEDDLDAAFATARAHVKPSGLLVVMPDHLSETFEPETDHGGSDAPDGSGIRYLEWTRYQDSDDRQVVTDYVYALRDADGTLTTEAERHHFGLFAEAEWSQALASAGFEVTCLLEQTDENRPARRIFLGVAS
ncbi:MAG: class I SAM-dependent methyltransferase [Ornithinimicrobium sp.]